MASYPKVQELNAQIADADRQFTLLKQRYRAKHPTYIAAQTQISLLTQERSQVLQNVISLLKSQRQQLRDQHDNLKQLQDSQQTHSSPPRARPSNTTISNARSPPTRPCSTRSTAGSRRLT